MNIIAITVSVNYNDILKHILNHNAKFFKLWYIVTSPNDIDTISYVQEANLPNVRLLLYDYFFDNNTFNKGGAIRSAQDFIFNDSINNNILLLDSDVYLPDNILENIPNTLDEDTIYGANLRKDYWTLDDFINNKNYHEFHHNLECVGFFQLYKQSSKYKYVSSMNCAGCDSDFRALFKEQVSLDILVCHLGKGGFHWHGRNKNNRYENF